MKHYVGACIRNMCTSVCTGCACARLNHSPSLWLAVWMWCYILNQRCDKRHTPYAVWQFKSSVTFYSHFVMDLLNCDEYFDDIRWWCFYFIFWLFISWILWLNKDNGLVVDGCYYFFLSLNESLDIFNVNNATKKRSTSRFMYCKCNWRTADRAWANVNRCFCVCHHDCDFET